MSLEAINWAFNLEIPSSAKFVLFVLSNYADSDGLCFLSFEEICKKTSLNINEIKNYMDFLEKNNFLNVIKDKNNMSYKLNLNAN